MNILLDTHVLIWALENNPTLSDIAVNSIIDGSNIVFVSAASVYPLLSINHDDAQLAGKLPNIHKDPFDRILIAQAINEKLILVTRDKLIAKYNVQILKA